MNTETLDKLFLEWSQFTKARTARELAMRIALEQIRRVTTNPARNGPALQAWEIADRVLKDWEEIP